MAQIKITLTKSPIGRIPSQRKTVVSTWTWQIEQLYLYECEHLFQCFVHELGSPRR